jgi:hypothetical protein
MKRLFHLSASVLMLAIAFHFGYTTARAQAPGNPVVAAVPNAGGYVLTVFTANGDVYYSATGTPTGPWVHLSNVFTGGPTPTLQESWGALKSRYAPSHAPTSQTPTNR